MIQLPKPGKFGATLTLILSFVRICFIPLFLFCNAVPEGRPEGVPGERHPRCCHLHRACQEENCHCHGRCLCSEEAGQNFVRLRRLVLVCKRCVLCPSLVETLCGRSATDVAF